MRGLPINYNFPDVRFRKIGKQVASSNVFSRTKDLDVVEYENVPTLASWYPPTFARQRTDRFLEVTAGKERPDLVCRDAYRNTDRLYWIIMVVNYVIDPLSDVEAGQRLRVPAYNRVISRLVG